MIGKQSEGFGSDILLVKITVLEYRLFVITGFALEICVCLIVSVARRRKSGVTEITGASLPDNAIGLEEGQGQLWSL